MKIDGTQQERSCDCCWYNSLHNSMWLRQWIISLRLFTPKVTMLLILWINFAAADYPYGS